jgi:hypothetical protein
MMRDPRGYPRLVLFEDTQDWFIAAIEEALHHAAAAHNGIPVNCAYVAEKDSVFCAVCRDLVRIHDPRRN